MDLLRQQIIEKDLEKFDRMTEKSRIITDQAIQEYMGIYSNTFIFYFLYKYISQSFLFPAMTYKDESTNCRSFSSGYSSHSSTMCNKISDGEEPSSSKNPDFVNLIVNDFQLLENDMQQKEDCLKSWEVLQEEVHDLHELFVKFEQVIKVQAEPVNIVEQNIETTSENVSGGLTFLRKAERFKTAWYPLAGAVIGGCVAGPIGLVTGLKIGGLAILSGTAMGFTGGKILKHKKESDFHTTDNTRELPSDVDKKQS